MVFKPQKAFILAAGMGTRMRPLSDLIPKPMVEVAGRSLIYHILDKLEIAGVRDVMVNLHYKSDILQAHLDNYRSKNIKIHTSYEPEILNTGGGVANVLPFFDGRPFYVIAGDAFWTEKEEAALDRLSRLWDENKMDIITLMQPLERMKLTKGIGDYELLDNQRVRRSLDKKGDAMWTNIRLNHPKIYEDAPLGEFSFLPLMDKAQATDRLRAIRHAGDWHHISTPEDLASVNKILGEG